jgi:hypothetical protein
VGRKVSTGRSGQLQFVRKSGFLVGPFPFRYFWFNVAFCNHAERMGRYDDDHDDDNNANHATSQKFVSD